MELFFCEAPAEYITHSGIYSMNLPLPRIDVLCMVVDGDELSRNSSMAAADIMKFMQCESDATLENRQRVTGKRNLLSAIRLRVLVSTKMDSVEIHSADTAAMLHISQQLDAVHVCVSGLND